ncbi:pyrroline-5-carboxylate reductase [Sediminibacterium soli]|uniref:pyrroline-5-carboxylate reductase n=1 Tax=Sediminibacterium soli TaxID=2698829 RepID=UPI0013795721|nr:pyrroline-5-carboxylate reductase [Sediminibacterium soli]NCI47936.1 pyrroline-5-carboxylate reductase [Sediminibacterium soli]
MKTKIAIIGGGNLGAAMAEGLVDSGFVAAENITVTRRNPALLQTLKQKGIQTGSDNAAAVSNASWVVLAVKPFQVKEVLTGILPVLDPAKHVLVSVVTGLWIKDIKEIVGDRIPVFRAMPNTAIAIQQSMTCICAENASQEQIGYASRLFDQLGRSVFIEEKLMDAATVLGACGTAYAMRYIRANIQGGIEIGFSAATASLIAAQTVKGAAELLLTKNTHPEQEIDKVTTPKGCTIAGLNEMEHQGFSSSLIKGVVTSYRKIVNDM